MVRTFKANPKRKKKIFEAVNDQLNLVYIPDGLPCNWRLILSRQRGVSLILCFITHTLFIPSEKYSSESVQI